MLLFNIVSSAGIWKQHTYINPRAREITFLPSHSCAIRASSLFSDSVATYQLFPSSELRVPLYHSVLHTPTSQYKMILSCNHVYVSYTLGCQFLSPGKWRSSSFPLWLYHSRCSQVPLPILSTFNMSLQKKDPSSKWSAVLGTLR